MRRRLYPRSLTYTPTKIPTWLYLEEELSFTDYASSEEELNAKEERIESAVYMIRTLKSVNDTSLSDWQGVIGEELDEQKEDRREKEERLAMLVGQVEDLLQHQREDLIGSHESTQGMRQELNVLKHDLRSVLVELGSPKLLTKLERRGKREDVVSECPACGGTVAYRQRSKSSSVKTFHCEKCQARLVARYSAIGGHYLELREPQGAKVTCPHCAASESVWIENVPGASANVKCSRCAIVFRATRTLQGVTTRAIDIAVGAPGDNARGSGSHVETGIKDVIDDKLVELVRGLLPVQPWPTGVHKTIAEQLHLEPKTVNKVLQRLMQRGDCKLQIDGKLYEQVTPSNTSESATPP